MTDAPVTRLLALASALVVLLSPLPAKAQPPSPFRVAAGHQHTLVVDGGGAVWAWGGNGNGELGDNSTTTRKVPQLVPGLSNVVAVAAGTSHSLALTASGTVHAFGDNLYGQIGDGTTTDRRTAVALSLTTVVAIAAGDHHSMALRSNGDVYVWGRNNAGQIGNGTTTEFVWSRFITQMLQDQVAIPDDICGPRFTIAARYHVHPPMESPDPSGPDTAKANEFFWRFLPFYLKAPLPGSTQTRHLKWWSRIPLYQEAHEADPLNARHNICRRSVDGQWIPDNPQTGSCDTPLP